MQSVTETVGVSPQGYRQDVRDMGFSLATGVLMVLVLIIFAFASYKFITGTLMNKLHKIENQYDTFKEEIIALKEKNASDRSAMEARITKEVRDSGDEMKAAIARISEKQASINTAVNMIAKRELNGSSHEES